MKTLASVWVLSCFSHVWLFATPWTIVHQAPLSRGFSRQECWSGLPFPPPGDLPNLGIELTSLMSLILAGGFFTPSTTWEAPVCCKEIPDLVSCWQSKWRFEWILLLGWCSLYLDVLLNYYYARRLVISLLHYTSEEDTEKFFSSYRAAFKLSLVRSEF